MQVWSCFCTVLTISEEVQDDIVEAVFYPDVNEFEELDKIFTGLHKSSIVKSCHKIENV